MATTIAAIAGLASAGAGIASSLGAFGGGGGGGGGGFGALNPSFLFLSSLFGVVPKIDSEGGIKFKPIEPGSGIARKLEAAEQFGIFGADERAAIEDFLTPLPLSEQELFANELVSALPDQVQRTLNFFDEVILPGARELAETGFRTDIDPIRQAAVRRLTRETVPAITEQFAGQTGTFSTDFLNALTGAAGDVETELGALQAELDEAASARRVQGLPIAGTLATTRSELPRALAADLFNFGGTFRSAQEAARPGGRALNLLQLLGGMGSPGNLGFVQGGFGPSQSTQLLSTLSQVVPGLVTSAGGLFGGLGGLGGLFGLGGGGGGGPPVPAAAPF